MYNYWHVFSITRLGILQVFCNVALQNGYAYIRNQNTQLTHLPLKKYYYYKLHCYFRKHTYHVKCWKQYCHIQYIFPFVTVVTVSHLFLLCQTWFGPLTRFTLPVSQTVFLHLSYIVNSHKHRCSKDDKKTVPIPSVTVYPQMRIYKSMWSRSCCDWSAEQAVMHKKK